ncbi:MAG: nitrilase-related carbon-nitrogen hydrolase [Chloroflexota bacterium]
MKKQQTNLSNNFAGLWLLAGACMLPFIHGQTPLFFAGWLAPLFLLRFSRTVRPLIALPAIGAAVFMGNWIAFRGGFTPFSGLELYLTLAGIAVAYMVMFAIDRWVWRRLDGVASCLVLPLASVSIGFLATIGNPIGTSGAEAYSQSSLTLLQLTSLFGIWSIVFLMYWFASVVNALWEREFILSQAQTPVLSFVVIIVIVMIFGSIRLTFFTPESDTVRMAAIVLDRHLHEQGDTAAIIDDLFARTEQEAEAGARIIVWSEGAVNISKEDEEIFLARAGEVAAATGAYLQIALDTTDMADGRRYVENRAVMFTPAGSLAWDYHKAKPTPGDPETPGPGDMPTIDTAYGRLATIICQDDLFPELVAQAGRLNVDILLIPSNDWAAVADWHDYLTRFRAIENGVNIIRPTSQGVSSAADGLGRTIARKADYFTADTHTLVAAVPTSNSTTLYPRIGDLFAYLSIVGLLVVLGTAFYRGNSFI